MNYKDIRDLSPEMLDATEAKAKHLGFRFVKFSYLWDGRRSVMGSLDEGTPIEEFFEAERQRRRDDYPSAP